MGRPWTLMSTHGVVLFYVAASPDSTIREISTAVRLTDRYVVRMLQDLSEAGLLRVEKQGRRNVYSVNVEASFRHPTLSHIKLGQFEALLRRERPARTEREALDPDPCRDL